MDLPSGACQVVGNLGDNFSSITFDRTGQLYGSTGDGANTPEGFFKINKANATNTLVFVMGNGNDGEVIGYNRFDDKIYHWSGNGTVVYESFPVASTTYSPTNITISGTTGGETFGVVNLSATKFLISNINSQFKYASTTGLYGVGLSSNPEDIRGMVMPPRFAVSSTTACAGNNPLHIYSNCLQEYDSVYYFLGDGNYTQLLATNAGTTSHSYASAGIYTLTVQLFNGIVTKNTIQTFTISVGTSPIVNITGPNSLCPGQTITLTASGGGSSQWYSSGVAIPDQDQKLWEKGKNQRFAALKK